MEFNLRQSTYSDVKTIIEIRKNCFDKYQGLDFVKNSVDQNLDKKNCKFIVAEYNSRIVGYLYYRFNPTDQSYSIIEIVVLPEFRRKGLGKLFIRELSLVRLIEAVVPDRDLDSHLFFKKMGFKADIIWGFFNGEDGYHFVCNKTKKITNPKKVNNGKKA